MRNYSVLYSDDTFRLKVDSLGRDISTLNLVDESVDKGTIQIVFHHHNNDDGRMRLALKAAADAFNASWSYYNSPLSKVDEEEKTIIHEIRIG